MVQFRLRPLGEIDAAVTHPIHCGCHDCALTHDPIGFARRRRAVRVQAVILGVALLALYVAVAACAPAIAAAFGLGW